MTAKQWADGFSVHADTVVCQTVRRTSIRRTCFHRRSDGGRILKRVWIVPLDLMVFFFRLVQNSQSDLVCRDLFRIKMISGSGNVTSPTHACAERHISQITLIPKKERSDYFWNVPKANTTADRTKAHITSHNCDSTAIRLRRKIDMFIFCLRRIGSRCARYVVVGS